MGGADFWNNQEAAKKVIAELKGLKSVLEPLANAATRIQDLCDFEEMASAESDDKAAEEVVRESDRLTSEMERLELQIYLNKPEDRLGCFLHIHAGAGGTESCDWAAMLGRMYTRYAERSGFNVEVVDEVDGEGAGYKTYSLRIEGLNAYGFLKTESGVHRLVRISPFDANGRRHTSFTSVDVVPEFDDEIDIEIKEGDLRQEFCRAGGAGGQHVNKTNSAVRLIHLPTGIAVSCRQERSQHKNKAVAMQMLKAKLYQIELNKRESASQKLYDEKGEISWGNQIRSYVLQPYQLIRDERTGEETSNVQNILDGELQRFIEASLRGQKREK